MNWVETLRSERDGRTVPLARFYAEFKNDATNTCYGFVEGKDDPSYYRNIIRRQLHKNCEIVLYPSNGKENVKYIFESIRKNDYPRERIVYFMDRDLSSIVEDKNIVQDSYVYITDGYSIENDILNEDTLLPVMEDILGFCSLTTKEKNEIKKRFSTQLYAFQEHMLPIMANIVRWKRESLKPANYNNLDIKKLFKINECLLLLRVPKDKILEYFYDFSGMDYTRQYDSVKTNKIIKEIQQRGLSAKIIRGKYLSDFFVMFCNSIYRDHERIGINQSHNGRLLSKKDIMETVAPRSYAPESLRTFINETICRYFNSICVA